MGIREQAVSEVQASERRLREILKAHVDSAPYEDIIWLSQLAERVKALVPVVVGVTAGGPPAVQQAPASATATPRPRSGRQGYPKFEVRGDLLIKTGWAKKAKKEYVHRAPLAVLTAVQQRLAEVAKAKPLFTMEDVMPVASPDGNGEVPGYQVYLCVAYLVAEGQVRRQGRDGYVASAVPRQP